MDFNHLAVLSAAILLVALFNGCTSENNQEVQSEKAQHTESAARESSENQDSAKAREDFSCDYMGQEPPGDEPKIFAPGIISTSAMEYRCVVAPNGRDIYFTRESQIMVTKKNDDGGWTNPEPAPFSGRYIDGESAFSPDGNSLYFCSRRPMPNAKVALNMWVVTRQEDGWSKPRTLGSPVDDQTMHTPTISSKGTLFASGLIKLTFKDGKYSKAEKLNPDIRGSHPFVAPDESYLIFGRREGSNGGDLYIIYKNKNESWTNPINLGDKINTPASETNASVSPDGKYIFFGRNHSIYWVSAKIINDLKPEALK